MSARVCTAERGASKGSGGPGGAEPPRSDATSGQTGTVCGERSHAGPVVSVSHRRHDCESSSAPSRKESSQNGHLEALTRRQGRARRRDRLPDHIVLQLVRGERHQLRDKHVARYRLPRRLDPARADRLAGNPPRQHQPRDRCHSIDDHRGIGDPASRLHVHQVHQQARERARRLPCRPDVLGLARVAPGDHHRRGRLDEHAGRRRGPRRRAEQGAVDDERRRRERPGRACRAAEHLRQASRRAPGTTSAGGRPRSSG